ncbi:MAG: heme-binding protein [Vampirovibrionales bacterium]|nr:heme-binding protein [Vampirovibrionales bacterium]
MTTFLHWMLQCRLPMALMLSLSVAIGLYAGASTMAATETPPYAIIQSAPQQIEIREYPELIVAETTTQGDRQQAANQAFRILADYIFGNNQARKKSDQASSEASASEKLAMTAPVIQTSPSNGAGSAQWQMQFVMPQGATLASLPLPNHPAISLKSEPARRVVVIRFSGTASEKNLQKHLALLVDYAAKHRLSTQGEPAYAFYNPPWTLPFMRRNEIMLRLQ